MSRPREPTPGWKAVAAATSDGVGILDGDRFAYADDRLAELFGYGSGTGDLVDREWRELCAARECDRIDREVLPHVRSGTPWRGTVTGQRADGSTFLAELSLHSARGELVVWTATDAGGATVGGAGSRETPAPEGVDDTHRQLFDTAPVPVGVFTADDEIVYCNQAAVEFLGADGREEVVGRSPEAFVHPDDRERVGRRIAQVIEERESTAPLKERFVGLDGEERVAVVGSTPATYDGEPAAQVLMNDVTEYERTQARLQRERRFLESVMDAVDDIVYVLDEDGEFYDWNEGAVETLGYTHEELDDMHPVDVIPEDHHEYVPGLLAAIDAIEDRRVDVDLLTKDGERLTHEFKGTTFEHPKTGEHFRCGVARDVTGVRRLQRELREEHRFVQNVVDALEDVLYVVDEDGTFVLWNDEANERFGYTDEQMAEIDPTAFVRLETLADLPLDPVDIFDLPGRHDVDLVTKDGEAITHELRGVTYTDEETGESYRVGIARDVTERIERERTLERRRDELATLDHINEVLLETTREVIETASRESVERTVCERLAETDLYQFAWVGEREYDGEGIVPRVRAGDGLGYLDEVTITTDGGDTGPGPVGRAMRTGEVQVANVTDPAFAPWRDAATERGFESVAAVPLHNDGSVYGVLALYATNGDAFSLREQAGFDVLGRAVGSVIYAARNRDLLFADAVVELEFSVDRPESDLLYTAVDLECELALDGYVSSGEQWILYVTVDGVRPDLVKGALREDSRVERARVVSEKDGAGRVELVVDELPLLSVVSAVGATLRAATAAPSGARVVVEAPVDAEIREVVSHVQSEYPGWNLVATRERDREVSTAGRPGGLLDELTDRQREAIEAGFRAGYFAWPRESTAEEVAESLDVAPPTLHGHLRKAEQAILAGLLDGR